MDGGLAAGIVGTRVWGIMSTGAFWGGTLLGSKPYLYDGVFLSGGYPSNNSCLDRVCVDPFRYAYDVFLSASVVVGFPRPVWSRLFLHVIQDPLGHSG